MTSRLRREDKAPLTVSSCFLQQTEGFKKRWFTLDHRRLMYYKDPLVRPTRRRPRSGHSPRPGPPDA